MLSVTAPVSIFIYGSLHVGHIVLIHIRLFQYLILLYSAVNTAYHLQSIAQKNRSIPLITRLIDLTPIVSYLCYGIIVFRN